MSLTLQFEDEVPDLFVTKILSPLQPHELVYKLNNLIYTNYKKEHNPFVLKRKGLHLNFQWFSHRINAETEHYFVSNLTYQKQTLSSGPSLFNFSEEVETHHYLLPASKKYNYLLLTLAAADVKPLKQLQKNGAIQKYERKHLDDFKRTEKNILQNIYYEKQG